MKRIYLLFCFLISTSLFAQNQFTDIASLYKKMENLAKQYPEYVSYKSLSKSVEGSDIWVLEVGKGDKNEHPGIAIFGGLESNYVAGTEFTIGVAEKLLALSYTDSVSELLTSTTFYFFPLVNPDATKQFFADLKYDRAQNSSPVDDDRDGMIDEDPYEDLNGDGLITMIRVEDPTGEWTTHPQDSRIMLKAPLDVAGQYMVYSEGVDNDRDLMFNEDGPGGVVFNRNFPFNYQNFAIGAGDHPVSEAEHRAILNYLYDHWNIYLTLTFGPGNNLINPWKSKPTAPDTKVLSSILKDDEALYGLLSERYCRLLPFKTGESAEEFPGGFAEWAYFHYGRISLTTPGWAPPDYPVKNDTVKTKSLKTDEEAERGRSLLRWADSTGIEAFVPWTRIDHPDFPGKRVELGGIHPFAGTVPPHSIMDSLIERHALYVLWLAKSKSDLEIVNLKTEPLGEDVFRVSLDVVNRGLFPSLSAIGERNQWVKLAKIELSLQDSQEIISGNQKHMLKSLASGASEAVSWLVRGKGIIHLKTGAPQTGYTTSTISL